MVRRATHQTPTEDVANKDGKTAASKPSANGGKTSRSKKKQTLPAEPSSNGQTAKPPKDEGECIASDLPSKEVQWLWEPWITGGALTLLVGQPGIGKSTFLAWLIAMAKRAVVLPGREEDLSAMTKPRWIANGVDLTKVKLLIGRDYFLLRDRNLIAKKVKEWDARVLVIDPVDTYFDDCFDENRGQDVQRVLGAAASIALDTGAAVVAVRHPGKDPKNVCAGSRHWRTVPRSVVELTTDGASPPKYLLRHYKDSQGQETSPVRYSLEGEKGKAKAFVLGSEVSASEAELAAISEGPKFRRKVVAAAHAIRHLFECTPTPRTKDLRSLCRGLGIGENATDDAMHALKVRSICHEVGDEFYLVKTEDEWPEWSL